MLFSHYVKQISTKSIMFVYKPAHWLFRNCLFTILYDFNYFPTCVLPKAKIFCFILIVSFLLRRKLIFMLELVIMWKVYFLVFVFFFCIIYLSYVPVIFNVTNSVLLLFWNSNSFLIKNIYFRFEFYLVSFLFINLFSLTEITKYLWWMCNTVNSFKFT